MEPFALPHVPRSVLPPGAMRAQKAKRNEFGLLRSIVICVADAAQRAQGALGYHVEVFRRTDRVEHGAGGADGEGTVGITASAWNNANGKDGAEWGRGGWSIEGEGGAGGGEGDGDRGLAVFKGRWF